MPARVTLVAIAALVGLGCSRKAEVGAERGEVVYAYCAQCHGDRGEGKADFNAPAIAGLPQWYVELQLHKFRDGARGDHPGDVDGLRMRPMSRTLADNGEVRDVSAHVANMPATHPPPLLDGGDAAKGKVLYASCAECHGPQGEGKQDKAGPPLAGANDWYLASQLQKFKDGVRGADPQDDTGLQMRPLAVSLANEQAIKDVVAHIMTF